MRDAFHGFESETLVLNSMAAPNQAMQEASQATLSTLLPLTLGAMAMLLCSNSPHSSKAGVCKHCESPMKNSQTPSLMFHLKPKPRST